MSIPLKKWNNYFIRFIIKIMWKDRMQEIGKIITLKETEQQMILGLIRKHVRKKPFIRLEQKMIMLIRMCC